jgi:hypothetical protein
MNDVGPSLATLMVVVMFNMVCAGMLTFIRLGALQESWAGQAGLQVTPRLKLGFAILLEMPIAMICASRSLKRGPGRWANTGAAAITSAFVVGGGSPTPHYVFFAAAEVACTAPIVWSVWTRRDSESD